MLCCHSRSVTIVTGFEFALSTTSVTVRTAGHRLKCARSKKVSYRSRKSMFMYTRTCSTAALFELFAGSGSVDIDPETKRVLLRSRQATSRPSPERSPTGSRRSSFDAELDACADKKLDVTLEEREVHLQEIDPCTYFTFGSLVWT